MHTPGDLASRAHSPSGPSAGNRSPSMPLGLRYTLFLLTSRVTVDGGLPSLRAISRMLSPPSSPRSMPRLSSSVSLG